MRVSQAAEDDLAKVAATVSKPKKKLVRKPHVGNRQYRSNPERTRFYRRMVSCISPDWHPLVAEFQAALKAGQIAGMRLAPSTPEEEEDQDPAPDRSSVRVKKKRKRAKFECGDLLDERALGGGRHSFV